MPYRVTGVSFLLCLLPVPCTWLTFYFNHVSNKAGDDVMEKKHVFDDPKNVKRLLTVFFTSVIGLLLLDALYLVLGSRHVIHTHMIYKWEGYWGFYCFYGFVACVVLVLVSKYILRPLVKREENYYDK